MGKAFKLLSADDIEKLEKEAIFQQLMLYEYSIELSKLQKEFPGKYRARGQKSKLKKKMMYTRTRIADIYKEISNNG